MEKSQQRGPIPHRLIAIANSNELHQTLTKRPKNSREINFEGFPKAEEPKHKRRKFMKITSILKSQKPSHDLHLNIASRHNQDINFLISKTKDAKNVHKLTLKIQHSPQITDSTFKKLYFSLKHFKNLSSLVISTPSLLNITDRSLSHLFLALTCLKNLSKLHLNFSASLRIDDQALQIFTKKLHHLKIQDLTLNLSSCNLITTKGLENLSHALQKFNTLHRVHFGFSYFNGQITSEGVIKLFSSLKPDSLESLRLNLHLSTLNRGSEGEPFSVGLSKFLDPVKLQNLELKWYLNFNEADLRRFASIMSRFKRLQGLNLNFDVSTNRPTQQGIKDLLSGVATCLPSLHRLKFSFSNFYMLDDSVMDVLATELELCTQNLSHLGLNFCQCTQITDSGIQKLGLSLKKLTLLTHLDLNLTCCNQISNKGIQALAYHLKSLENLKELFLNISLCALLTSNAAQNIAQMLTNLPQIKSLSLSFTYCQGIKDDGIEALDEALKSLNLLENLFLGFSGCVEVSEKAFENLVVELKDLRLLHNVGIYLPRNNFLVKLKGKLSSQFRNFPRFSLH